MRRPPAVLGLALVALLVAAGFGAEHFLAPPRAAEGTTAVSGPATSGAWYCAVGDTEEGRSLSVSTAVADLGTRSPSEVVVEPFAEGRVDDLSARRVFPGTASTRTYDDLGESPGVAVRWWDAPSVAWRTWRVGGGETDPLPEGLVSGPCQAEPSDRWIVPGLATAGGAEAHLTLVNPFGSDASVAVAFATPAGRVEPQRLQNVVVPARSTRDVLVNDFAPDEADLGALVTVRSGRVVAEAYQALDAAIGGLDAVTLVEAAPAPAEAWTVPWFQAADDTTGSWLWVTNLEDRPAAVAVSVHSGAGGSVPDGLEEITIEPGRVRRIDLADALPGNADSGAVSVRSDNGVPVTASAVTQIGADSSERGGLAVQLGARTPDEVWVLDGGDAEGRTGQVALANPSADTATVDLTVWNGSTVTRPDELQDVAVPSGAQVTLDVDPGQITDHTIFVTAERGAVVAGVVTRAEEGPLGLAASAGVPGSRWRGGEPVAPVQAEPGLGQRVGTDLGVRSPAPLGSPTPRPSPTVAPTGPSPTPTDGVAPPNPSPGAPTSNPSP